MSLFRHGFRARFECDCARHYCGLAAVQEVCVLILSVVFTTNKRILASEWEFQNAMWLFVVQHTSRSGGGSCEFRITSTTVSRWFDKHNGQTMMMVHTRGLL